MGLAVVLCGCRAGQSPRFELVSARTIETTNEGVLVELSVLGENPTDQVVLLREARYAVEVEGAGTFRSARSPEVTLPRYGRVTMTLPVALKGSGLDVSGKQVSLRGQVLYLEPGALAEVLFDARLRRPSVSVQGSAVVDR